MLIPVVTFFAGIAYQIAPQQKKTWTRLRWSWSCWYVATLVECVFGEPALFNERNIQWPLIGHNRTRLSEEEHAKIVGLPIWVRGYLNPRTRQDLPTYRRAFVL